MASDKTKFHFVKTQAKNDVWLEKSSIRIAPLHTHTKKPKLQTKSELSCVVISSDLQAMSKNESELEESKLNELKTSQLPVKRTQSILPPSGSIQKCNELRTEPITTERQKVRIEVEDEDESDGLSFVDMDDGESEDEDDEESDAEIGTNDDLDDEGHRVDGGKYKGKVGKSPTVTDVSSSDGSLKRDFESTHVEHSDNESECVKESDQSKSEFKIPKKKSKKKPPSDVIPKKLIPKKQQSSSASGKSLISDAARQAMLEKNREKTTSSYARRPVSRNHSPSKETRQADRNKICLDDRKNPSSKRRESSELHPSQKHRNQSPSKRGSQSTSSPFKSDNYRQSILSPRHSLDDKYSIEQRRERELYRDSNDYTARGQDYGYQDSSGSRDYSGRINSPNRSYRDRFSTEQRFERDFYRDSNEYRDRHSFEQRRERDFSRGSNDYIRRDCFGYQNFSGSREYTISQQNTSDHERGIEKSAGGSYDGYSQREQYGVDRCFSRDYDRSHYQDSESRYPERSREYYSRSIPSNDDVEYDHNIGNIDGSRNSRRIKINEAYHEDYRRYDDRSKGNEGESCVYDSTVNEGISSRRARSFNEKEIDHDSKSHRLDNGHEQMYHSHSDDNGIHRDDNRHNSRRRRGSESRREKRRKRKFDGSDEYSRRLGSYNHPHGRNYFDEAAEREHYDR